MTNNYVNDVKFTVCDVVNLKTYLFKYLVNLFAKILYFVWRAVEVEKLINSEKKSVNGVVVRHGTNLNALLDFSEGIFCSSSLRREFYVSFT